MEALLAQRILGKNFIGVDEAASQLLTAVSSGERRALQTVPWSEEVLQAKKRGWVLFPGLSLTIADFYQKFPNLFEEDGDLACPEANYIKTTQPEPRWCLMSKRVVRRSLLEKLERQPLAVEVTAMVILFYLTRGTRLLRSRLVWCQDRFTPPWSKAGELGAIVGGFVEKLTVCSYPVTHPWPDVRVLPVFV